MNEHQAKYLQHPQALFTDTHCNYSGGAPSVVAGRRQRDVLLSVIMYQYADFLFFLSKNKKLQKPKKRGFTTG